MPRTMRRGAALAALSMTAAMGAALPANAGTAGTLEVTAVDFAFEGVPTSLDAGKYTIAFSNDGAEPTCSRSPVWFELARNGRSPNASPNGRPAAEPQLRTNHRIPPRGLVGSRESLPASPR